MASTPPSGPPLLPTPTSHPFKGAWGDWLAGSGPVDDQHRDEEDHPWYAVLWLTGMDYFSSLGFQPGLALLAAGSIAPLATLFLIALTLGGAVPIYFQVAKRSYSGQGSIAMLERLLKGWWSKLLVLALLGFAATDFVITMTLCAADASEHLIHNPFLEELLKGLHLPITLALLGLLAGVFLLGFSEAVNLSVFVGIPYILLNFVLLGRCLSEVVSRPELISNWQTALTNQGDPTALFVLAALAFPKLALGLSGFETGVSVMPLVDGGPGDSEKPVPEGRIKGTHKLLLTAALLMSGLLLISSFVTTLLIARQDYATGGKASGRALAYLAHTYLGDGFGTAYDLSTIVILWFAGSSAMAGLLNLLPRYLPRFGMAPAWIRFSRPLVLVLLIINVIVTLIFKANVEAQGGAYATGVLALILSGALAVSLALGQEARTEGNNQKRLLSFYFWAVTVLCAYTFIVNIFERPDGLIICGIFITAILIIGALSRSSRATELRVERLDFTDQTSSELWPALCERKVWLVPVSDLRPESLERKRFEIRNDYVTDKKLAFVHIKLLDDRSEFLSILRIRVTCYGEDYFIEVEGATTIANTIAYVSELIDPAAVFLKLRRRSLALQSLQFLLFGEGETALTVYQVLEEYWRWTPEEDLRPRLILASD
ncbi:MAG: hypothetical protein H7Y37_08310 [Anaerolineae bacterium]|nr:hypothetical protein [Gloeobacterales cyanobacterium ES-bin-313]